MSQVEGNFIPLPTPYTDDGRVLSEIRIARLVRHYAEARVEGLYLCGEIGEFLCLSSSERKFLLELTHRSTHSAIPTVVNVSSLSTAKSLDLAQHASRHGARGVIVSPPHYGTLTQVEHYNHIRAIANFANTNVILHDFEGVIDPSMMPLYDAIPQLTIANGSGWDDWSCGNATCDSMQMMSSLLGLSQEAIPVLLKETSRPALAKAAFGRLGIDIGSPRSPRLGLDQSTLDSLFAAA